MFRRDLLTSVAGIRWEFEKTGDGKTLYHASQDLTPIIDHSKRLATENDGYSPDRTLRRVAHIPAMLRAKWLAEEGWDCFDPHHSDRLVRKLNDPDYAYLRTAPGRVAVINGGEGFR